MKRKLKYQLFVYGILALPVLSPSFMSADDHIAVPDTQGKSQATYSEDAGDKAPENKGAETITELSELVVEGKNSWVETDKIVFIPTKAEKNLSTSAGDLIDRMGIPILKGNSAGISTLQGKPVHIFINGREATPGELQMFWPSLAKKVEYLPNPIDPKYKGYDEVVNFVMTEYVAGGVSKFWVRESYPWSGWYGAASKLVYKKMTYLLSVSGNAIGSSKDIEQKEECFDNVYYDGVKYDRIRKVSENSNPEHSEGSVSVKAAAYYNTGIMSVNNEVQFTYSNTSKDRKKYGLKYYPPVILDSYSISDDTERIRDVYIKGFLYRKLKQTGSFNLGWVYNHTHNNTASDYRLTGYSDIWNATKENSNSIDMTAALAFAIRNNVMLSARIPLSYNSFNTRYIGSTGISTDIDRFNYGCTIACDWQISRIFRMAVRPTLQASSLKMTAEYTTELIPSVNYSLTATPNQKNYSNVSVDYSMNPVGTSYLNDVLVRSNEMLWLKGNQNIKPSGSLMVNISHMFFPSNKISVYGCIYYIGEIRPLVYEMIHPEQGIDGLIRTYHNGSTLSRWSLVGSCMYRPVKGLSMDLEIAGKRFEGPCKDFSFNCFSGTFRARYMFSNFEINTELRTPNKVVHNGGMQLMKSPFQYSLGMTYSNGHWNVRVYTNNLFIRHRWNTNQLISGDYASYVRTGRSGNDVSLSVEYIFGYGKKVDPGIEMVSNHFGESSVLK